MGQRNVSRRKFLGLIGASATGAVIFEACGFPEEELIVESPLNMPEDLVRGEDQWYATSCGISSYGESVIVRIMEGRAKKIAGNPDFPNNLGKQNVVAETNLQMLYHPDRITTPLYRRIKSGSHQPITWDSALTIFEKALNDSKGKSTIITNPLRGLNGAVVKAFSNHNSMKHLQFDPINQGLLNKTMKLVFDQDRLPYFDIENSNLIISFGLDFLGTWGPVHYRTKYGKFKSNQGKLISVEPRMSLTSANADKWICPSSGSESIFALGLANKIITEKLVPKPQIDLFKDLIGNIPLSKYTSDFVNQNTGLEKHYLEYVANAISESNNIMFLGGGPLEGYNNSEESMSIIYALNYLTNSVGTTGGILFNPETPIKEFKVSETSLPLNILDTSHANNIQEWYKETSSWESGKTDLLITRGSNIIHGLPFDLTKPLDSVKLKVCFTTILDDTAEISDLILPEYNSLEDWGIDIPEPLMGYQTLLFQQPLVKSPTTSDGTRPIYDSKSFYDVLISSSDPELRIKNYKDLIEKFTSHLFSQNNLIKNGSVIAPDEKLFLEGILTRGGWWNINSKLDQTFKTPKNIINISENRSKNKLGDKEFYLIPFLSNSLLDGKTAASPWAQGSPDPITTIAWDTWAEFNPKTAKTLGLKQGDLIELITSSGKITVPVFAHPGVPHKVIGVPIGQGHKYSGRYAEGRGANVLKICDPKEGSETLSWAQNIVTIKKVGPNQSADDALHEAHEQHIEETFKDKH